MDIVYYLEGYELQITIGGQVAIMNEQDFFGKTIWV